jgi:hypothetical protein
MQEPSKLRPENLLVIALVVLGISVLAGLILILPGSTSDDPTASRPFAAALGVVLGGVAVAFLLMAWARRIRRRRRPQWLETQGWHAGMVDQVRKGPDRPPGSESGPSGPA